MTAQTEPSLTQQVIDRCRDALFTGIVRVRTRQAEGDLRFLSGILERVRFGVSTGDEAMHRLLAADLPKVEVVACLPDPAGGFKKGHPVEGPLGETRPVDLLRFCEMHALSCTIELRSGPWSGEVVYRLGELVSVRCDAGTERAVAKMLEWSEGQFRFILPLVDVPRPEQARPSIPPPAPREEPPPGEETTWRNAADEALKRKAEELEAKQAEAKRVTDAAKPARKPSKAQRKRQARKDAAAQEQQRKAEEAQTQTVLVRLERVTREVTQIAVPLTDAVLSKQQAPDGSYQVDADALLVEANRLAREQKVAWEREGEPVVGLISS